MAAKKAKKKATKKKSGKRLAPTFKVERLDTVTNAMSVARVLGVDKRTIEKLAADGTLPKLDRGQYNLLDCVRAYAESMAKRANSRGDVDNDPEAISMRRSLLKAQTLERTTKANLLSGGAISREEHDSALLTIASIFVSEVDSLAGRLAPVVVNQTDTKIIHGHIASETDRIRTAVADQLADQRDTGGEA